METAAAESTVRELSWWCLAGRCKRAHYVDPYGLQLRRATRLLGSERLSLHQVWSLKGSLFSVGARQQTRVASLRSKGSRHTKTIAIPSPFASPAAEQPPTRRGKQAGGTVDFGYTSQTPRRSSSEI